MAKNETTRNIKIGLLVGASLLTLMAFIFFIGSEQKLFSSKNEYHVRLETAGGLAEGNPVQLSGVKIGTVKDIHLPRNPQQKQVDITIQVERKFADRIRQDSRARLKKLGLIASDSYIDISPGSPQYAVIEPGSIIPAHKATDVDALIASGEDLVDNFVQISHSLKNVLARVDRGEGLLGELTTEPETKQRITDTLLATLNQTSGMLKRVESGRGLVSRLLYDEPYADELSVSLQSSARSLRVVMTSLEGGFESGNGALPALLTDPEGKEKVIALIDNLRTTSENLAMFSEGLQTGEGLVPRLINDKEYGDQALREFTSLVSNLNQAVEKINGGSGTAGRLINDPSVYESVNDILIGINESKLLRWLIRNRQAKGIETRYDAVVAAEKKASKPAAAVAGQPVVPVEPPPAEPPVPPAETAVQPVPELVPVVVTPPSAAAPAETPVAPPPTDGATER